MEVDLLLLPHSTLILCAHLIEPLRAANRLLGERRFDWHTASLDGRPVATASGIALPVDGAFEPARAAPLVIAASYDVPRLCRTPLRRQLHRAARCRPLLGAGDGAVVLLAELGLLAGYRAAVHPEDIDARPGAWPAVEISAARWVIDRERATARGAAAALEMMLALLARWSDRALADAVARLFDYPQPPSALIAPAAPLGVPRDPVGAALRAMDEHLADPLSVPQLAALAGVSPRCLHARFRRELGQSPRECYRARRLARARQLLLETDWSVAEVAAQCGYSAAGFSRAFQRHNGRAPSALRAAQGERGAGGAG